MKHVQVNDLVIRQAKPTDKPYTLSVDRGLILTVHPNGSKYWIVRAWVNGKERRRSLGTYPEISLKDARIQAKKLQEALVAPEPDKPPETRFDDLANEWLANRMKPVCRASYLRVIQLRLNKFILPRFGDCLLTEINTPKILKLCREIEAEGKLETAARVRQLIYQLFKYAIVTGRAEYNPADALSGALLPHPVKHMAAITEPNAIGLLIRNIRAYPRKLISLAMQFSAYTFARPGEVRHAEWSEIDMSAAVWSVPAEKMKMNRPHRVPLSRQVLAVLEQVHSLTHRQNWVFPSMRWNGRCMSENTVRVALRSMGYANEEMTPHGFRGMASTRLNELGFAPDVIERQLAHLDTNAVRAAYNRADYFQERQRMMQFWADYLDALADGRTVPEV